MSHRRDFLVRRDPLFPSLHADTEHVVFHKQIAVGAVLDSLRHDCLDLLRHHADISFVAAKVTETVEPEPVIELPLKGDIVLRADVRGFFMLIACRESELMLFLIAGRGA